ncbi:hypothetical protein MLD38_008056 [Melastoma candidum]|uniref:Uncharacterized protein n=1 Tax=Melastoma candidum TaxID=119954 RepID=A0ACB9RST7_9MYRT|nr:hypothetical protein MLD38_008056 [Melastoma candidum]
MESSLDMATEEGEGVDAGVLLSPCFPHPIGFPRSDQRPTGISPRASPLDGPLVHVSRNGSHYVLQRHAVHKAAASHLRNRNFQSSWCGKKYRLLKLGLLAILFIMVIFRCGFEFSLG